MILPGSFKKLIAVFRGEVSPIVVLLSVALGFWFGLTPGWYGLHVFLLVLVLVFNVHLGMFVMFAGLGAAFRFAAAPVLFQVGKWTQGSLTPVVDFFAALPMVGITDFARYSVAGSLIVGPILGLILGLLLARSVSAFRRAWLTLEENSEAFRKWHSNRWVRLLDRVLVGKRTKDVRAVLKRRPKIIRIAGVAVAAVLVIASVIGLQFVKGDRLTRLVRESLTKANGAEVNLERLDLAVLSGRVTAKGLQVTDPENPTNNRIAVGELRADASLWDLSRGKLVMDDVVLAAVEFDQPRAGAGEVTAAPTKDQPAQFDPLRFRLAEVDVDKLETYFADTEKIHAWCEKLAKWLPKGEEEAPSPPAPERYLEYLTARAPVPPTPRILVKRVVLDDVRVPAEQVGNSTITCTNLSDAPAGAGLPVTIALQSRERPVSIEIVCHYDQPQGGAEIRGTIDDVDLRELQSELNPNNPVTFEGGTAAATISGTADRRNIDLAIVVKTQGMRARSAGGGVFGLDPQVTSEALRVLENLQTTLRLVGPTSEPRLVFDTQALTGEFRNALVNAGKAELARRVDDLLADQLPEGVPKTGDVLEDPLGAAGDALGALLPGQKQDDQQKDEKEEKEEEKKKDKDDVLSKLKERLKKKP